MRPVLPAADSADDPECTGDLCAQMETGLEPQRQDGPERDEGTKQQRLPPMDRRPHPRDNRRRLGARRKIDPHGRDLIVVPQAPVLRETHQYVAAIAPILPIDPGDTESLHTRSRRQWQFVPKP